ncbi:MAG: hypothetical protein ACU84Q_16385, partial [Gammaproteobacteria bacterium]
MITSHHSNRVLKYNFAVGELRCLVDVPPEYEIVKKLARAEPRRVETTKIPAGHQVVRARKLGSPASKKRIQVSAEKVTLTERTKTADANQAWHSVLCEINTTKEVVKQLQQAPASSDPYDWPIGATTGAALSAYQDV